MSGFVTEPHGWPVRTGTTVVAVRGGVCVVLDCPEGLRKASEFSTLATLDAYGVIDTDEVRDLAMALSEAADIVDAVRFGQYRPPSRTTRPRTVSKFPAPTPLTWQAFLSEALKRG